MGEKQELEVSKAPSLSEFVSAAILDIAAGLRDAQDKGRNLGVKIYPESYEDASTPMEIEFDLSVTSITQTKTDTGIKIGVFTLGMHCGNEGAESIESMNRIRFKLPVHYVVSKIGQNKFAGDDWNPIAGKM